MLFEQGSQKLAESIVFSVGYFFISFTPGDAMGDAQH